MNMQKFLNPFRRLLTGLFALAMAAAFGLAGCGGGTTGSSLTANDEESGVVNISGTGTDTANDADPDNYEIDTATLEVADIPMESLVGVRGFVRPFGQAPKDFDAITVAQRAGS